MRELAFGFTAITRVVNGTPARRVLLVAALAMLSGLLSNYVYDTFGDLTLQGVPPMPAIYFGIVLAVACRMWTSAGKLDTLVILGAVFLAWFAAFKTADQVHNWLEDIPSLSGYRLAFAGLVAGFVGSGITAFGISLVARDFRNTKAWSRTVIVGTVAGSLLECLSNENQGQIAFHLDSLLPLFLVWQPAVAASIAYGLSRPGR